MLKYNILKDLLDKFNINKESVVNRLETIGQRQSALNLQNWNEVDEVCKTEICKMAGSPTPLGSTFIPEEVTKKESPLKPKTKRRTKEEIDKENKTQKQQWAMHQKNKEQSKRNAENIQNIIGKLWDKDKQKIKDPEQVVRENVKQLKLPL
jgi:hypothetical protein